MSKRARVLVIDDDPLFRSLLVSFLRHDYFVSVATEGSEGFYQALEHPPEIAIIDIQMPGWDGLKTLGAFRSHGALADVKIVILTSDASEDTITSCIRGGADCYIIKTHFTKEDLHQKLDRLVPKSAGAGDNSDRVNRKVRESSQRHIKPVSLPLASNVDPGSEDRPFPIESAESASALGSPENGESNACEEDDPALQDLIDDWE